MLFRRNIEPRCCYCKCGAAIDEQKVICRKRGMMAANGRCLHFKYDPLKRVPKRPASLKTEDLETKDFSL